jgi:hypothetical protein
MGERAARTDKGISKTDQWTSKEFIISLPWQPFPGLISYLPPIRYSEGIIRDFPAALEGGDKCTLT